MCLAAIGWQTHPRYRLVLIANRDEFHARPSLPIAAWPDRDGVLAGRDLQAGGTWLGLHRSGRFGLITNFRDQHSPPEAPTRGQLIPEFLEGDDPPGEYLQTLAHRANQYAGFNLLLGDQTGLWYASNRHPAFRMPLSPGVYALSNHLLDTPWPKLTRLREALQHWLQWPPKAAETVRESSEANTAALWQALNDRRPADVASLPKTGIPLAWEQLLSSPFIVHPEYGTRSSTVVLVGQDNGVRIEERSYANDGQVTQRQCWKTVIGQWPPVPDESV